MCLAKLSGTCTCLNSALMWGPHFQILPWAPKVLLAALYIVIMIQPWIKFHMPLHVTILWDHVIWYFAVIIIADITAGQKKWCFAEIEPCRQNPLYGIWAAFCPMSLYVSMACTWIQYVYTTTKCNTAIQFLTQVISLFDTILVFSCHTDHDSLPCCHHEHH